MQLASILRQRDLEVEYTVKTIDAQIANRYHMGPIMGHARAKFRSRLRSEIYMMLGQLPERDYWRTP